MASNVPQLALLPEPALLTAWRLAFLLPGQHADAERELQGESEGRLSRVSRPRSGTINQTPGETQQVDYSTSLRTRATASTVRSTSASVVR